MARWRPSRPFAKRRWRRVTRSPTSSWRSCSRRTGRIWRRRPACPIGWRPSGSSPPASVTRYALLTASSNRRCSCYASDRSTSTSNELLDLARNVPPKRRPVSLRTLLDTAIADARLPDGVEVSMSVSPDAFTVVDPDQLGRVLTNLMTNAAQAMEGAGRLWVDATKVDGETRIRVRDNGPGIPPGLRSRIFEALVTTRAKGTGLGLALCRRSAEAHGGSITLEPSSDGACFLLSVPERKEHAPA